MAGRLGRRFFRRDAETLGRSLLGHRLVRVLADGTRLAGRIVEVEAYLGVEDRAAHTFGGRRTDRNEAMWGEAGHAYVYFTYGMHHCLNIVAARPGAPTAVLLRALEPTEGLAVMRANRAGRIPAARLKPTDLCSGPAKLAQAMAIDRALDHEDLTRSERLWLERGAGIDADRVVATARVGVGYAQEWAEAPLRFYVADSPHVSRR